MENFQGVSARLNEGVRSGIASECDVSISDKPSRLDSPEPKSEPNEGVGVQLSGTCACVK